MRNYIFLILSNFMILFFFIACENNNKSNNRKLIDDPITIIKPLLSETIKSNYLELKFKIKNENTTSCGYSISKFSTNKENEELNISLKIISINDEGFFMRKLC